MTTDQLDQLAFIEQLMKLMTTNLIDDVTINGITIHKVRHTQEKSPQDLAKEQAISQIFNAKVGGIPAFVKGPK